MFKKKHSAFALLEIAIAVAILGLISGFFVMKMTMTNRLMRNQITKTNIEICAVALAAHVANYYHLPKPIHSEPSSPYIGRVPYTKLGINEKDTKDGRGKYLTYIVEPLLTNESNECIEEKDFVPCFCQRSAAHGLIMGNDSQMLAFVLDESGKIPPINEDGEIIIRNNAHTFVITRDMLLMKYLKMPPCRSAE